MMHADLIDQEDFRERLRHLGFDIPQGAEPGPAWRLALAAADPSALTRLRQLADQLLSPETNLLPAVREAISRH